MISKKHSNRSIKTAGFTLIEVMLVLMMMTVVGGVSVHSFVAMSKEQKAKDFLTLFESDLLYAQQYALSHESNISVRFDNYNKNYLLREGVKTIHVRHFREGIVFERGTLHLNEIVYRQNGNISKSGAIFVDIDGVRYRITFLLGKGRFYFEKL